MQELKYKGSQTQLLGEYIINHYDIPDHRRNVKYGNCYTFDDERLDDNFAFS